MDDVLHFIHRLLWGPDIPMLVADPATTALLVQFAVQAAIAVAASAIINVIFPTRIEGPKLSDLHVQSSTYGNAIPLLLGRAVRVAGNVIWSSGLQETKNTESAKGGPQVSTYTYKVDCAIALGERPGGIAGILKIWGFGKLIYDGSLSAGGPSESAQGDIPNYEGTPIGNEGLIGTIASNILLPIFQGPLATQAVFESITVYPGDFAQMPDPTMEAALGIGNVPAYRGTAYVVIKGLQLADFGNVLPNLEFLVIPNPEETVGDAVEIIVQRAGIASDQYRICHADPLKGYAIARVMTATAALQPLAFAHNFDIVDDAGLLRLIERDEDVVAIISTEDLAGHAFGEDRPDPIQWERAPVTQLPREASVTFSDPARDFQENSMTARRSEGSADSNISIDLAMTLEADDARALADRALWEAWLASQMAKIQSTDKLIDVRVGRVYLLETPAGFEAVRVFAKTRGRNGVIEFELRRERGELYSSPNSGSSGAGVPTQEIPIPGPTELILLDIPLLRDADNDPGFYFAVAAQQSGWRGAAVMRALSISEDFITFQSAGVQSVVGDVLNTLPDGPTELDGSSGQFDEDNFIDVELRHDGMTLESVSDEAIAAGANAAYIGPADDTTEGEIVQFGIATFLSGTTWRLSHLKRGKRGTEFATSLHGSGEIFVLLRANGSTMRADFGVPDLDLERLYKAVSLLLNADDVDHVPFTNTGVGLRPYSPRGLEIDLDTNGDMLLHWTRRSRLDSGALGEETELYTVRIYADNNTTLLRETSVTEPEFLYTAAMQTVDFGAPVVDLCWRVAQVSAVYGNGIFAESCGAAISSGELSSGSEDIHIAVKVFDTPTSTGNQDITTTVFGGGTPELALYFASGHIAANDPGDTANARMMVGATAGGAQAACGAMSLDNQAATDVRRTGLGTAAVVANTSPGPTTFLLGAHSTFLTNGARINWSTVQASAYRGIATFMGGTDFQAAVGSINLGTGTAAITTSIGFAADAVLFFGPEGDTNGADFFGHVLGIATRDGTQKCVAWSENDAIAAGGQPSQVILSNKCAAQQSITASTQDYTVTAGNFTATAFDVTPSANANSDRLGYVALKFTGRSVKLWEFTTPTATGDVSDMNPGFTPEFGLIIGTNLEAMDTGVFDANTAGGLGIGVITATDQAALSYYIDATADPTNTGSDAKSGQALRIGSGTGSGGVVATLVSRDLTGWTLNYSAVQANGKKCFALAVSE